MDAHGLGVSRVPRGGVGGGAGVERWPSRLGDGSLPALTDPIKLITLLPTQNQGDVTRSRLVLGQSIIFRRSTGIPGTPGHEQSKAMSCGSQPKW